MSVIANNSEKYMSFTIDNLKFIDSVGRGGGKDLGPEDNENFSYTSKGKISFKAAIPYCIPDRCWTCNIHYVRTSLHYVVQWYITQYSSKNEEKYWVILLIVIGLGLDLEYIRVVYKKN